MFCVLSRSWALLGTNTAPGMMIIVSSLAAMGFLVGGAFYFRRMEKTFADVVKQTCSHVPMLVESKVLNGKHYNMCVGCNCSWAYKPEKIGEGGWHHELVSGSM